MSNLVITRVFAALLLATSITTIAQEEESKEGTFGVFEPDPQDSRFDTPVPTDKPEHEGIRQRRLNDMGAKVSAERTSENAILANLRGKRLGKIDRSIDAADTKAVEAELRRYLKTMEDFVGPVDQLELGEFRISPLDPTDQSRRHVQVLFSQLIHGARAGRGMLLIDGDEVVKLQTFFVNPNQELLDREKWASRSLIREAALRAVGAELNLREVDTTLLAGPELMLKTVNESDKQEPWYKFRYRGQLIQVHAITLETKVQDQTRRAAPTDVSTVTCDEIVVSGNRSPDINCQDTSKSTVIFAEDSSDGSPVCVSSVFGGPRIPECDDPDFLRYHEYLNSVESYVKALIPQDCCAGAGGTYIGVSSTSKRLDIRSNSSEDLSINSSYIDGYFRKEEPDVNMIHLSVGAHQSGDAEALPELIAHEWYHAYLSGYNSTIDDISFTDPGFVFARAFDEGLADFLAIIWSQGQGIDTNNYPFDEPSRNISTPRTWTTPNFDHHASGRVFSNFFYRVATYPGVTPNDAVILAMSTTRALSLDAAVPTSDLDHRDFREAVMGAVVPGTTMEKAVCNAWRGMGVPNPPGECIPDSPSVNLILHYCDLNDTRSNYELDWNDPGTYTTSYWAELWSVQTGWFLSAVYGTSGGTVRNDLYSPAWFRVSACNEWYCSAPSVDFPVPDICDPNT